MINNDGIRNCIMKGETHQIYSMIEIGRNQGMQLLDDSLVKLYKEGKISQDSVISKASDPVEILNQIQT